MTVAPAPCESVVGRDFDAGIDTCGLTPAALQNIREQMALSLERMKELEDQVKLIPSLKVNSFENRIRFYAFLSQAQLAALAEDKRQLLQQLKVAEAAKISAVNNIANRNRSQSFSEVDNLDTLGKVAPRPPPRRDFGVMCGVLTRNVGVGHQYPHTKTVSTLTVNGDDNPTYTDKWYKEKIKFLTNQNENLASFVNETKKGPVMVTQNTQTVVARKIAIDCGTQTPTPKVDVPKRSDNHTQTQETKKRVFHVGTTAKPINSEAITQTSVERRNVGISIETPCDKCSTPKTSVGVGSENTADAHISPVSLANLAVPRSKSFNLGSDKLNLSARSRTVGCQYEMKTHSKACQNDVVKTSHKGSQHEYAAASKTTDTKGLAPEMVHVACEAREEAKKKADFACNTNCVPEKTPPPCPKCTGREKEEAPKKEGSPTPSRIPRPQIPTTPVECRKFRRQDTYTKIPASPTDRPQASPTG